MTSHPDPPFPDEGVQRATRAAVAQVIQRMAARRLGKGLVSLAVVFLFGVTQMVLRGPLTSDYALLGLGALIAAGATLVYGNGAVHRALGREGPVGWATTAAGVLPYAFAFYLLGFRGLKPLASLEEGGGPVPLVVALLFVLLATRLLWDLSRLTRLHGMARTMTEPAPGEGA